VTSSTGRMLPISLFWVCLFCFDGGGFCLVFGWFLFCFVWGEGGLFDFWWLFGRGRLSLCEGCVCAFCV
jgi:hypothetical protein